MTNMKKTAVALVGVMSMVGLSQASQIITHHTFDSSTAADNGYLGPTVYNNLVSIDSTAKVGAGSMRLDGTASRLTFNNSIAPSLSESPQFTLMFWAYREVDTLVNENDRGFLYADQYDNNLRLTSLGGVDTLQIYAEGVNGLNTGVVSKSSLLNSIETWVHIGVQYDLTASTLDVFINGTQSGGSINISAFDDVTFNEFRIGTYGAVNSFVGLIDDFAVVKGNLTSQQWTDIASGQSVSSVIPEPATMGLFGGMAAVLLFLRRLSC